MDLGQSVRAVELLSTGASCSEWTRCMMPVGSFSGAAVTTAAAANAGGDRARIVLDAAEPNIVEQRVEA